MYMYMYMYVCRMFNQTLSSGGGQQYIEAVSLCACFLLEASKKADKFNLPPPTTAHTIRDSGKDIEKMVSHLHEAKVNIVDEEQTSPPVESGWTKLWTTDWLENALARNMADNNTDLEQIEELDLDYELADMV